MIPAITALDECRGTMHNNKVPCMLLLQFNETPLICGSYSVSIYNQSTLIYSETMGNYSPFMCNATFNQTGYGTYNFQYSTGDTGSIVIEEDIDNRYYLYIVALITFFILLGLGYYLKDRVFITLSGITLIVTALNIFINGFSNLVNELLRNGIVVVLWGIGAYLIIAPYLEFFENFKWEGSE